MEKKFDFKDITIVPETVTYIDSRKEINILNEEGKLPIMVAPMDTVIGLSNYKIFLNQNIPVCLPRETIRIEDTFFSVSLETFESIIDNYLPLGDKINMKILVDIANGHLSKLHNLCKKFIKNRDKKYHKLMVGNIANPSTYQEFAMMGVDYVRVGIGGGSGCLTSANTGVHYPMGSLVNECYKIKKYHNLDTKIVADGGFRNYDDIIKALALGADYIMLGGMLNKCLESSSKTKLFKLIPLSYNHAKYVWDNFPKMRKYLYKTFRGMSTKEVQREWGKANINTSEGIIMFNRVEYTLEQWVENFEHYLRTAMSYTNSYDLESLKYSTFVFITQNALNRYYK